MLCVIIKLRFNDNKKSQETKRLERLQSELHWDRFNNGATAE